MKFEDLKKCLKENESDIYNKIEDVQSAVWSALANSNLEEYGYKSYWGWDKGDACIEIAKINSDESDRQADIPVCYLKCVPYSKLTTESEIDFSNMTPEEIDEYYSNEYYKKTQEATDPEEKFENACYTAASQWMSGVDEDTDEEFIRTMIVPIAKNTYNNPDKTDKDYFNQIVFELQNGRGIKFNFNK